MFPAHGRVSKVVFGREKLERNVDLWEETGGDHIPKLCPRGGRSSWKRGGKRGRRDDQAATREKKGLLFPASERERVALP